MDDSRKLKQKYEIKSYECDRNKKLRIRSLFNIFQDMADTHANILKVGYYDLLSKNLGWVGANYEAKIFRMPEWREKLTVYTWPSVTKICSALREFEIYDEKNNLIVCASSQWALIDLIKGRPAKTSELGAFETLPDRAFNTDFKKTSLPESFDYENIFPVRLDDTDMNIHVNNGVYPSWAYECSPSNLRDEKNIIGISVAYKKPLKFPGSVKIASSSDNNSVLHVETSPDGKDCYAVVKIEYK